MVGVPRHPNFRLLAAMNPATDAGKRDLPAPLRNRFTEVSAMLSVWCQAKRMCVSHCECWLDRQHTVGLVHTGQQLCCNHAVCVSLLLACLV